MSPITQTPIPLSDEWATPAVLFECFQAEFDFTLDACARPWNAKLDRYITPEENGLVVSWAGERVWVNPPYSDIGSWAAKAHAEAQCGAFVVMLVPCVPDRKWWAEHVEGKAEIRYLTRRILPSGRVHFEREDGTSGRAPFPSALLIYRGAAEPSDSADVVTELAKEVHDTVRKVYARAKPSGTA